MPPLSSALNAPLGSQTQAALDAINSQITSINASISTINSQIATLQSQMTTANNNITALQGRMTTAEANITSNANAITALAARVTAAESNITKNTTDIATLNSEVAKNTTDIAALATRVGTVESNIVSLFAHDSQQDQALSDLDHRVTALEQGGSVSPGGPFIGDLVHTKDADGHCQPSIVYEDWDGQNAVGTLSIAVLSPVRLADSPWDSYIEVHPDRPNSLPFTTWHWPEMAFQYRRNLFLKVAAHASRS